VVEFWTCRVICLLNIGLLFWTCHCVMSTKYCYLYDIMLQNMLKCYKTHVKILFV
jgi:hypothetical protein